MRRAVVLSILLAILGPLGAPQTKAPADMPALAERYKKWLGEEAVYLITKRERDVFLKLQTDRERDIFIDAFWKQRDPTPGTPRNEFEEEHRRRLDYANQVFGRSTPLPGWKTDRGRIYIILGPPKNIEQYTNVNGVYPTEIWFYLGDTDLGLPTAFNIIFFRKEGSGDYILYSPTEHGPRSLIASSMGGYRDVSQAAASMTNDQAAYKELQELEPNLARQTLSLIPGENAQPGYESMASTRLMATIAQASTAKVAAEYADAILKYKDLVEVEYTANYVPSEVQVQVIRDAAGQALVHYSVEPSRLTAEQIGGKYEIRFQLNGRVSDAAGRTVYQFDKDIPISLTADELQDLRAKSLSLQDVFPLVPGTYSFDILVKNVLSKEFTGAARTLQVPGPSEPVRLSPLLLAYRAERTAARPDERVPFRTGDDQLLCQARKVFVAGEPLVLFYQVFGLTEELRSGGLLRTDFLKEDKPYLTRTAPVSASGPDATVLDHQPLKDFAPGYYQARVVLLDRQGREVVAAKENFEVSPVSAVPRPLVVSKVAAASGGSGDFYALGIQAFNQGDLKAAQARLSEASARAPKRADIAAAYAQVLFQAKDYLKVKEVLRPWSEAEDAAAEVLALYGQACHALGEYQDAAAAYARYLVRNGANIDILNYLGTCHFQLGNTAEALKAWEKSLELKPDQERLRALVESVKKK